MLTLDSSPAGHEALPLAQAILMPETNKLRSRKEACSAMLEDCRMKTFCLGDEHRATPSPLRVAAAVVSDHGDFRMICLGF